MVTEAKNGRRRCRVAMLAALATVGVGLVGPPIPEAGALPAGEPRGPSPRDPRCLRDLRVRSFAASPATVNLGQPITLSWNVFRPAGCTSLRIDLRANQPLPLAGSTGLTPLFSTTYYLHATYPGAGRRTIGSTSVTVLLPRDLTIGANNMAGTLRQALGIPGQIIRIRNNVVLNLSAMESIRVADNVKLIGARTPQQDGPLLYSTTRPSVLFSIRGDGVRIHGVRIRGRDRGVSQGSNVRAIAADSVRNLEVDNNEIFGWRGVGVEIRDNENRISHVGAPTIRIHDNYIHNNQNYGRLGYGVSIKDGAYGWIERNVFDYNRHAIEGDGSRFSGYRAYDNLVLPNGGRHRQIPITRIWIHTHQFDMHGSRNCGFWDIFVDALYNCGLAGNDMDFRYNSFLYTRGAAIKVRGTPGRSPCGAQVYFNVFRHTKLRDAAQQTESGMCTGNNRLGVNSLLSRRNCDVNGDGLVDSFLATGQTWWYSSGRTKHWVFVRRSTERPTSCPPPPPPPPTAPQPVGVAS
jgi:hypothetical protein